MRFQIAPGALRHPWERTGYSLVASRMAKNDQLRWGPPGNAVHVCVDMQNMFAEETEWRTPWFARVLPNVVAVTTAHPERTVFTRFIPAQSPGRGTGGWRRYYQHWSAMTIDRLGPQMVDLVPDLAPIRSSCPDFR